MPMHFVSKTGLVASPKKQIKSTKSIKKDDLPNLSKCAIARPVQFSLRPFGGLYNPYAKGCSILCNHPGPNEVKTVVRQAKDAWLHDTKPHCHDDRTSSTMAASGSPYHHCNAIDASDLPEHVPEEFFRRYTGSDSRPMTPTPTVASGRTRTSTGSHVHAAMAAARRCFTPDPGVHSGVKERKQLILDLRRSQSQETLYWNASSELTPTTKATANKTGALAEKAAGHPTKAGGGGSPMARSKSARGMRLCEQEAKRRAEEKLKAEAEVAALQPPPAAVCINALDEYDDGEDEAPRRRGKRKKKSNKPPTTATYKVSQEPETQIATLGPDSPNQSNRPSLVPNGPNAPPSMSLLGAAGIGGAGSAGGALGAAASGGASVRQSSFISEEAMKYLRRGLNIDVLEGAFDRYMNLALTEAIRTVPPEQLDRPSDALLAYQAAHPTVAVDPAKWLSMPRKYTRKSVRFTLPINTYDLETLTPFQYVSQHVWLSAYRKELCRYVFAKHQPPVEGDGVGGGGGAAASAIAVGGGGDDEKVNDPLVERTLSCATDLDAALSDVLGFYGTAERIGEIRAMLGLRADEAVDDNADTAANNAVGPVTTTTMNFRSWCGVVAFGERYLNTLTREEDPCDEIEVADFTSLERKFANVNVSAPMRRLLTWIKYN